MMSVNKFIEFMNLYLSSFDFCVMAVMFSYIFKAEKDMKDPAFHLAIGLLLYITGHFWLRFWTWLQWYGVTHHHLAPPGPSWYDDPLQIPMFAAGMVLVTIGLIYILRPLSATIDNRIWYYVVPFITIVSIIITWFT